MPGFFKRPDPEKNFFYNYFDHLNALGKGADALYHKFSELRTVDEQWDFLEKVLSDRNLILQPLRDGYDYMDEVIGATVLPTAGALTSLGLLVFAVWEVAQSLAINLGFARNDREAHADNALQYFLGAALVLAFSAMSFIKSCISLISRPIATAEHGFAKQDKDRFYNEDKEPAVEAAREGIKEAVDGAASVLNRMFNF